MKLYLEHTRSKAVRFEVLSYDPKTGVGRLRGGLGTEFTRNIDKASLERYSYKLRESKVELPLIGEAVPDDAEEEAPPQPKKKKAATPEEDDDA